MWLPPPPLDVYTVDMAIRSRPLRSYILAFRVLSWLVVVTYFGQAVLAGQFLSGTYPALRLHGIGGTVADFVVVFAVVTAALLCWHGKGRSWPFWAALGLLVLNQVQNGVGAARMVHLHIPLGVAMLGVAVAVALAAGQDGPLIRNRAVERRTRQERSPAARPVSSPAPTTATGEPR